MASGPAHRNLSTRPASADENAPRELSRLDILRGMRISTWEASFSTLHATLTTGAFLTGFALWLGADSLAMGLLTAIPTFAGLVQIVASYMSERRSERRRFTAVFSTVGRSLWLLILLLPVLLPRAVALYPFLLLYTLSFVCLNIPAPAWMSWMSDLVPADHRGRYFAHRNTVAGIVGMGVGLPAAWFLDMATRRHHWEIGGFGTLFSIAVMGGLVSCGFLLRQPEPQKPVVGETDRPHGFAGILAYYRAPFADIRFRRLMAFNALLSTGQFFAAPFFTVYALERLHLDYTWLQILATLTSITSLISMPLWGFLADKVGNRSLLAIGVCGVFTLPITWAFTSPHHPALTLLLLTELNLAGGLFWAGVGLTQFNLLILSSPSEKTSVYVATMAAVVGLAGGIAPLLGGVLMHSLAGWHGALFGIALSNFQVTFLVSAGLRLVSLLFLRSVNDPRSTSALDVLQQLSRARPRTWMQLRQLQGGSEEDRLRATEALGETRTHFAVDDLQAALMDPSAEVRQEAARALGVIGAPDAVSALLGALDDPVAEVVEEAIRSLGHIGDREANPVLIRLLSTDEDQNPRRVRLTAVHALGQLGGPDATDALLALLQRSTDEELREAVIRSLGEIGDPRSVPPLLDCLAEADPPRSVRLALIRSLGQIGDPSALDGLRGVLRGVEADTALLPPAADALARLRDTASVLPIVDRLEALDSAVARKQTAYSVGILLDIGREIYHLLSREEFARDEAIRKLLGEMERSLRAIPSAEATLRTVLETYTEGDYHASLVALARLVRSLPPWFPPDGTGSVGLCRVTVIHLADRSDTATSLEAFLLALCAFGRMTANNGKGQA